MKPVHIENWVMLTFTEDDDVCQFLFGYTQDTTKGKAGLRALKIKDFDPINLSATCGADELTLNNAGFEAGFSLSYLSPANEPDAIIYLIENIHCKHDKLCIENMLDNIQWIRFYGESAVKILKSNDILNTLQLWNSKNQPNTKE